MLSHQLSLSLSLSVSGSTSMRARELQRVIIAAAGSS